VLELWKEGRNVNDFDKRLKAHQSLMTKSISAFFIVWILAACASVAGVIALVYVAAHFLAKFW